MSEKLITIQNAYVHRNNVSIFENLNLVVNHGEQLAIVGKSGSGKTALLEVIAGKLTIQKGLIRYNISDNPDEQTTSHFAPKEIAFISSRYNFRSLSNTTDFYYQQRFNSLDSENAPTVQEHLNRSKQLNKKSGVWTLKHTIERLRLTTLLSKQLIKLSNGETKRLLLGAALLKGPRLLLLDNPLTGLDAGMRQYFNELLLEIVSSGISVMMTVSPEDIPDAITHVALIKNGQIQIHEPKAIFRTNFEDVKSEIDLDRVKLASLLSFGKKVSFDKIVDMLNVSVKYGDKVILSKINWRVKQGEKWALLGPNGAGKSTLLSLINGDNPQAYANNISLFDRKRGTGESIWDIKSKIGFVSPELFQYFPTDNTCSQVVVSGIFDTLGLFRPSSKEFDMKSLQWLDFLKVGHLAAKRFKEVSASSQRLVLLARALIKNPALLILDEPCQGLDTQQQLHFKKIIDAISGMGNTTLIYVSHYQSEIPESVMNVLQLDNGRIISEIKG